MKHLHTGVLSVLVRRAWTQVNSLSMVWFRQIWVGGALETLITQWLGNVVVFSGDGSTPT